MDRAIRATARRGPAALTPPLAGGRGGGGAGCLHRFRCRPEAAYLDAVNGVQFPNQGHPPPQRRNFELVGVFRLYPSPPSPTVPYWVENRLPPPPKAKRRGTLVQGYSFSSFVCRAFPPENNIWWPDRQSPRRFLDWIMYLLREEEKGALFERTFLVECATVLVDTNGSRYIHIHCLGYNKSSTVRQQQAIGYAIWLKLKKTSEANTEQKKTFS